MSGVYYRDDNITLYTGDAAATLSRLPPGSVDCVVTSPPSWGLRDYGTTRRVGGMAGCSHPSESSADRCSAVSRCGHPRHGYPHGQQDDDVGENQRRIRRCSRCGAHGVDEKLGVQPTPQAYVERLRGVFDELRRVVVDNATVWLNLGDSYTADPRGDTADPIHASTLGSKNRAQQAREHLPRAGVRRTRMVGRKNLIGMPWRVALALQADGWILRNAIVWHTPHAMGESVRERCSHHHELLFLLTAQQRYYFDLDAIREPYPHQHASTATAAWDAARVNGESVGGVAADKYEAVAPFVQGRHERRMRVSGRRHSAAHPRGKNPGDVWSLPTRPLREAHFAAYPIDLPLRAIAAGCPPEGVVLDPFSGAASTALAARQLDRRYVGIELNPEFNAIGLRRLGLSQDQAGDESGDVT